MNVTPDSTASASVGYALHAVRDGDRTALLQLAVETGRFTPGEAEGLLGGVFDAHQSGTLPPGHAIRVLRTTATDAIVGWLYAAPDAYADAVWNLWWIGVHPSQHGAGAGTQLLRGFEQLAREASARVLIIETSGLPALARAHRFYEREGYRRCGVVPDFYGDGDDKVIFARSCVSAAA